MDRNDVDRKKENLGLENRAEREEARAMAAAMLDGFSIGPSEKLADYFIEVGLRDANIGAFFLAMEHGKTAQECWSQALRSWSRVTSSDESQERWGPRAQALQALLVEVGRSAVEDPPVPGVRINTSIDLVSAFGDPVTLSLALSMPGLDPERLAVTPIQEQGHLPLSYSAGSGAPGALACCEILLDLGADPNESMNFQKGLTPLYSAIKADRPAACALLVMRGADPMLLTDKGEALVDLGSPRCKEAIRAAMERMVLEEQTARSVKGVGRRLGL